MELVMSGDGRRQNDADVAVLVLQPAGDVVGGVGQHGYRVDRKPRWNVQAILKYAAARGGQKGVELHGGGLGAKAASQAFIAGNLSPARHRDQVPLGGVAIEVKRQVGWPVAGTPAVDEFRHGPGFRRIGRRKFVLQWGIDGDRQRASREPGIDHVDLGDAECALACRAIAEEVQIDGCRRPSRRRQQKFVGLQRIVAAANLHGGQGGTRGGEQFQGWIGADEQAAQRPGSGLGLDAGIQENTTLLDLHPEQLLDVDSGGVRRGGRAPIGGEAIAGAQFDGPAGLHVFPADFTQGGGEIDAGAACRHCELESRRGYAGNRQVEARRPVARLHGRPER